MFTRVEHYPATHNHAKAILGDAIHFIIEAYTNGELNGHWRNLHDASVAHDYLERVFLHLCRHGNKRYPERANLPIRYGRRKFNDPTTGERTSEEIPEQDFLNEWIHKGASMLVGYATRPFNKDEEGVAKNHLIEVGYELMVRSAHRSKKQTKGSGIYTMVGRMDQLRYHYSLDKLPESLWEQGVDPEELKFRLEKKGRLLELSDWKTTKDSPVFPSQFDPYVVLKKNYQLRAYALACAEGNLGDLQRSVAEDGTITEILVDGTVLGEKPDIMTYHWLPGYLPRRQGLRTAEWRNRRAKKGEVIQYIPGKAPGDPQVWDPRYSVLVTDDLLESFRKDGVHTMGSMRMGVFPRNPGSMTCTSCKVAYECERDMEAPILDPNHLATLVEVDDYDEE